MKRLLRGHSWVFAAVARENPDCNLAAQNVPHLSSIARAGIVAGVRTGSRTKGVRWLSRS